MPPEHGNAGRRDDGATYGASCVRLDEASGTDSITITAVDGCSVRGTFDVSLDIVLCGVDHLTGSFSAAPCGVGAIATLPASTDAGQACR